MESNIQTTLAEHTTKLNAIQESITKTERYFKIIMWVTIGMVVLPLIGFIFIVPQFLSLYTSTLEGLI